MKKKKVFNPSGEDEVSKRSIIKGNPTNLSNLNNVKYEWAKSMWRRMMENHWIPETISLNQDRKDYDLLTREERHAFNGILSFLSFLDSVQTTNLPNISDYITAPEVNKLLSLQMFQEAVHSHSYQYIIDTVIPPHKRESVHELWRTNQKLLERNEYIANIYQNFVDNSSDEAFADVIIANYVLESLYFYNGFIFFYNLADKHKMMGVNDEIRYINKDELSHVQLFRNIILEIRKEFPEYITEQRVHELFEEGVKAEIKWTNSIINNVLGMTQEKTESYTKYLANKRVMEIGFQPVFEAQNNPYEHLELMSDEAGESLKANFFESKSTNYNQRTALIGWGDF